jgi:m7GpppX diphosphatase
VHVSYIGFQGITVGQAHLLDDIIDNLELEEERGDAMERGYVPYFASRTMTYALGVQHPLYRLIAAHEQPINPTSDTREK